MEDNTMLDLENILNEGDTYENRVAEYLKRKTASRPQNNNLFLLNGFDISLDIDVDLIKLPPKPTPQETQKADKITKNLPALKAIDATKPQRSAVSSPNRSSSLTPRKSARRSSSVPGSDRLRRAAMKRRSHSLGRRDLMNDFENVSVVGANFLPVVSSTPAIMTSKYPQQTRQEPEQIFETAAPTNRPEIEKFENSFISNLTHLGRRDEMAIRQRNSVTLSQLLTLSHSKKAEESQNKRHTYTIKAGPEPGQLMLSPSSNNNSKNLKQQMSRPLSPSERNHTQSSVVLNLSAARRDVLVPDTPPHMVPHSQPNPEHIVPESPAQREPTLQNVLHNLSSTGAGASLGAVPITCISPKSINQADAAAPVEATRENFKNVASRSIQTSCNPQFIENINDIITDDDSNEENERSASPLNLAPSGSNTTRQRRLRKRRQNVESPVQLLNLHRTRASTLNSRATRRERRTVLNKPTIKPINGEEFAAELVRMSNYEILDLRKRNSQGLLQPLNGRKRHSKEQKKILEEHIEQEMLRRKLSTAVNDDTSPKGSSVVEVHGKATPPSVKTTDITVAQAVDKQLVSPVTTRNSSKQKQLTRDRLYPKRQLQSGRNDTTVIERTSTTPAAPPDNFGDTSIAIPQILPISTVDPVLPQVTLKDISLQGQYQETLSRQHRSLLLRLQKIALPTVPSNSATSSPPQPVEPPLNFCSPQKQLSTPKRLGSNISQQADMHTENELLAVCTPPAQFNYSTYRQQEPIMELAAEHLQNEQAQTNADNEIEEIATQHLSPTQHNHNNDLQIGPHMEEMQTETPLPPQEKTVIEEQSTPSKDTVRKGNKEGKENNQENQLETKIDNQKETQETYLFKKPSAPAPKKNNKSKLEKALDKIRIGNNVTAIDSDETEDGTNVTRKSKRGHVPLQNTWVHTVSDPFAFMRKQSEYSIKSGRNKSKKNKAEELTATIMKRPPLYSSTPHSSDTSITKNSHESHKEDVSLNTKNAGILSIIPEQQNDQKVETRGRKKKKTQSQNNQVNKESEHTDQASTKKAPKHMAPKRNKNKIQNDDKNTRGAAGAASVEPELLPLPSESENPAPASEPEFSAPAAEPELSDPPAEPEFSAPAAEPEYSAPASEPQNSSREAFINNAEVAMECESSSRVADRSIPLISWLRGDSIAPADTNHEIDMDLETNAVIISRAANLQFSNLEGVDYSFYKTGAAYMLGYMRFKPFQTRGFKRANNKTLVFVALDGQFILETSVSSSDNAEQYPLYAGDTAEVKTGSRYNLTNRLDSISVIMVYRK